ncbi:MAG: glutamate racemase [Flavobacteriia bacterium]|nr:MAG: glutamate racemase [Flavobacteriia bacterium]
MTNEHPIGLFDSGIGGTSVWHEIIKLMPHENTVYLADNKHAPYGEKSKDEIIRLSEKNTEFLLNKNAKIIVVACNTATTNAIKHLRQHYDVPFVGIEPAIKPAALQTQTNAVGVLATQGTLSSELFDQTKGKFARDVKVIEQIGYGLVELIESGKIESQETTRLLNLYLDPMIKAHIDYLILGCTHYPYLIPQIKALLPSMVTIIDSGKPVARRVQHLLKEYHIDNTLSASPVHQMYATGSKTELQRMVGGIAGVVMK